MSDFPGDPLRPTAYEWRSMKQAGREASQLNRRSGQGRNKALHPSVWLKLHAAKSIWQPVGIGAPIAAPTAPASALPSQWHTELSFASIEPAPGKPIVLLLDGGQAGQFVRAIATGYAPAIVNIGNANHTWCSVVGTTLQSRECGDCEIVWKPSGTGNKACVIRLDRSPIRSFVGTAPAAIAASASGTVTAGSYSVQARNEATGPVAAGSKVAVAWDDVNQRYYISMEFC